MPDLPSEYARPGHSSPDGKMTSRVDVPCTDRLAEALSGLAFIHGMTRAEYVREVLEEHAFGKVFILERIGRRPPGGNGSNEG